MIEVVFYSFSLLIIASALMVVTASNPIHSVLFLIFAFFNAAGIFILLGAEYIAMTLIIVYVGAVAVLFLFVVMMLDIEHSTVYQVAKKYTTISLSLAIVAFLEIFIAIYSSRASIPPAIKEFDPNVHNTQAIGRILFTDYFLPFQLSGFILLVAMIGAIMLTLRHAKKVLRQDISKQISRTREDGLEIVKVTSGKGVKTL